MTSFAENLWRGRNGRILNRASNKEMIDYWHCVLDPNSGQVTFRWFLIPAVELLRKNKKESSYLCSVGPSDSSRRLTLRNWPSRRPHTRFVEQHQGSSPVGFCSSWVLIFGDNFVVKNECYGGERDWLKLPRMEEEKLPNGNGSTLWNVSEWAFCLHQSRRLSYKTSRRAKPIKGLDDETVLNTLPAIHLLNVKTDRRVIIGGPWLEWWYVLVSNLLISWYQIVVGVFFLILPLTSDKSLDESSFYSS